MLDKILKRGGAISLSVDAARTYVLKFLKIVLDPRARAWYNRDMENTIQPSFKAPEMESALKSIFGVDRVQVISNGNCISCDEARDIKATSFRDDESRKEYSISGMCQSCQDDLFGVSDDEPEDPWDNQWADDDALGSAGMGTDEYYF